MRFKAQPHPINGYYSINFQLAALSQQCFIELASQLPDFFCQTFIARPCFARSCPQQESLPGASNSSVLFSSPQLKTSRNKRPQDTINLPVNGKIDV